MATSPSILNRERKLKSYLLATTAISAAATTEGAVLSNFSNPYELTGNQVISAAGTFQDWTGSFSNSDNVTLAITVENATPPTTLNVNLNRNFAQGGSTFYDFTSTANAAGNVSFDIGSLSTMGTSAAEFLRAGTSQGSIAVNNSYSFAVSQDEVFGFRFSVTYNNGNDAIVLEISNFSGPVVPEPAEYATWMSAGVVGMVLIREFRKRRRNRHSAATV